jgi:hypothetical protein
MSTYIIKLDPYSQLYKKLKSIFNNKNHIIIAVKNTEPHARSAVEGLLYNLNNAYELSYKEKTLTEKVFQIMVSLNKDSFTDSEIQVIESSFNFKIKDQSFYTNLLWGG